MKKLMENWRGYIQESEDDFSPHTMYNPKSGKSERAETKERHLELADRGYTHVDPEKLRDIINKEGGAAGLDAIVDQADASEEEVKKTLDAMDDVATHKEGDLVIDDGDEVEISEGEICDAGIQYVMRTDPGGKDIHRGDEDTDGDGENEIKNWSARAAQIASKKCKDPDYGTGKSKKKNEANIAEDCWDGYERVEGTEEGAPGSCRKKTDEGIGEMRSFQVGDQVRVVDGGLRGATGEIIEPITLVTGEPGFVILLDSPADKRVFGQAGDEVPVSADKLAPPVSAMTEGDLADWAEADWETKDGEDCGDGEKDHSGKRCKPKSKWKTMTQAERDADDAKKRKANKAGKYSVSATKKGKVTKSHSKQNESIFKSLRESLDSIEEAADYGNFPDEVLNYLQEKPNRVINGAMLAYAFGGAQQRHTRMLQMMMQQGKLEYRDGHYRLAGEGKLEEKPAKGKKSSKTYTNPDTGRKNKVSYGQKGAKISPGTSKGDSYCARSFGIKKRLSKDKQNDPNTPNNLSRKKWKCKGKKSTK